MKINLSPSVREVWFIRHGESVANAGGRTMEAGTYSLTDRGFRQADQLARALPTAPEFIVRSPYLRARQTAEPTVARFAQVPVEDWPVQEVQYLDPALCVNTTQDERHLLALKYWDLCDPITAAPNAESFVDFIGRAKAAIDALATRSERLTHVFCHGHFMRAVAWLLLFRAAEWNQDAMRHFLSFMQCYIVPNCSIQTVYFHNTGACSLGALWVPDGVEREPLKATLRGQEGT